MATHAPGKHYREGISIIDLLDMFPDDATAEAWFVEQRWPEGNICCPSCGSLNVQTKTAHKTMPYRCREKECKLAYFSVKTGTVMQSTKLPYRTWILALYLLLTSLKSVSSMKLHRDLKITQKSAWHLAHRLRKAQVDKTGLFGKGPIEADESHFGGRRALMSNAKRKELADTGRGAVGKTAVAGLKDRASNQVRAKVVPDTTAETLQGFIVEHADAFATVYTDESKSYASLPFDHDSVKHSASEYVKGDAHTNGMESFWSGLKRAQKGTFHKFSPKHLDRYVQEFAAKHNLRESGTLEQMRRVVRGMGARRLRYADLIADNGLSSGARSG
ncbi:MAG: IS1595 family transposase [Gemmatimonadota bacterium]|nr:IS1595 family transposase [Gemmatimonadota bacterium]